ncbi:MAG: hypothetical protein VX113_09625, partial [Pseudomonadota bacterium]|nr:hypothetical protein [Pseudomonadota bacterium]
NAERIFTEIISAHPTHAEAWNKRATVRFMRGDDKGSRSDIARVIDLEPRHFGALSGLGMINMLSGDLPAALQAFGAGEPAYGPGRGDDQGAARHTSWPGALAIPPD